MSKSKSEKIGPFDWVSEKVREWTCRRAELSVWRVVGESFLLFERTWFIKEPRAGIARVEKWVYYVEARLQSEVHTEVFSMFWGLDYLCRSQIIHNVLEMGREYFSMNAVIVQSDRPTTRSLSARVGDRKGSALAEQALLEK